MKNSLYIFILYICFNGNCQNKSSGVPTPDDFKYINSFTKEEYTEDSIFIYKEIKEFIYQRVGPYYVKEHDSLTEVFVDTILYSPNHDKMATFVITKNSNDKLLSKGSPEEYHFNAHCFIGRKESLERGWNIKWFRRLNFTRHETYSYVSEKIRYRYFNNLVQLKGADGESQYKYNFDDVRFWNGPVWDSKTLNNPTVFESGDKH